jgi:hypothetical protein
MEGLFPPERVQVLRGVIHLRQVRYRQMN